MARPARNGKAAESTFLQAARIVLESVGKPMRPMEIVNAAIERGLLSDKLNGQTPHQTMKAKLSVHAKRHGESSEFVRAAPGKFTLRKLVEPNSIYKAVPYRPPPPAEQVLVFPSRLLDEHGRFQGIKKEHAELTSHLLSPSACTYLDRVTAECTDDYKQVICYVLVSRGRQLLAFNRGTYSRAEDMLRGRVCIGFGGHTTDTDRSLFDPSNMGVTACAVRELGEELKLPKKDRERLRSGIGLETIGVLNDDSSPVGRRHFAVVFRYEVSDDPRWNKPEKGERAITQLRWLDPESSSLMLRDFEYWSQLCLRFFYATAQSERPSLLVRRRRSLHPPHVLVVLGALGSGKSEATRVLKEEFGYTEINSGRVLANLLGRSPVTDVERASFQEAAWEFIQQRNAPKKLAAELWNRIQESNQPRVVVDGLRQVATLEQLKLQAGKSKIGVLYVHTPPDLAFEFYRARAGFEIDIHEFLRRREDNVEREVPSMISLADAVVYNWYGRNAYRDILRELIVESRSTAG